MCCARNAGIWCEPEILKHFELVVNAVSMEEAVQQQLEADWGFEEDPDSDAASSDENAAGDFENDNDTPKSGGNIAAE